MSTKKFNADNISDKDLDKLLYETKQCDANIVNLCKERGLTIFQKTNNSERQEQKKQLKQDTNKTVTDTLFVIHELLKELDTVQEKDKGLFHSLSKEAKLEYFTSRPEFKKFEELNKMYPVIVYFVICYPDFNPQACSEFLKYFSQKMRLAIRGLSPAEKKDYWMKLQSQYIRFVVKHQDKAHRYKDVDIMKMTDDIYEALKKSTKDFDDNSDGAETLANDKKLVLKANKIKLLYDTLMNHPEELPGITEEEKTLIIESYAQTQLINDQLKVFKPIHDQLKEKITQIKPSATVDPNLRRSAPVIKRV